MKRELTTCLMLACNEKEMLAPSYFRKSSCGKPRQNAAMANRLNLFRGAASLLANAFGVGFIDWLGGQSGRGFGDDNDARRNKDIFEL